jgi:cell division protein FtsL
LKKTSNPLVLIIIVCAISAFIIIGTLIAYDRSSLLHLSGYIDKDYFPAFGSFIASLVGILFSATSMILIYYTYQSQQRLFVEQTKAINEQQKVNKRDYLRYVDSIRPLIELQFIGQPTSLEGEFMLTVKENSTYEIDVKNDTIIPVSLNPSVIHRTYLNKNTPIKFKYSRTPETNIPNGLKGEIILKISYDDSMLQKYEQTFTSIFEQCIFVCTEPKIIESWRESIKLD